MDENRDYLTEMNSVLVNEVIYGSVIDLNKKRKFEDDQSGLPLPKHKFGDRGSALEQEENFLLTCMVKDNTDGGVSNDVLKQVESPNGSITCFNSAISSYPEAKHEPNFVKVYTYNKPTRLENESSKKTYIYDQPSTSYGSCGSNSFKSIVIDSMDNISSDEGINRQLTGIQNLNDGLRFEENELPGFGKYKSKYETNEIEEHSDVEGNDEMKVDSNNEAESNCYVLSSRRWNVKHDAQVDATKKKKKPTIDQEFEQYFSMLML